MFGHTYYHGLLRKYVALFGTLFNDVYLTRFVNATGYTSSVKVPISYGPREKTLARLREDPDLDRPAAIILPRMSFEITDLQYASSRKLPTINRHYGTLDSETDKLRYVYNPVPYDISFTLSIIVKNADDGARIVEQILPFFTPEWTTTVELIPDLNIIMDIPTVLTGVQNTDEYEGDFVERRAIIWTLTFTMKAYFFGPMRKSGVIKFANTNFYTSLTANSFAINSNIKPGLTANGQPTSNADLSVDAIYINSDDDYGYIVTITDEAT